MNTNKTLKSNFRLTVDEPNYKLSNWIEIFSSWKIFLKDTNPNVFQQLENHRVKIFWQHIFKHVHPVHTTSLFKRKLLYLAVHVNNSLPGQQFPINVDLESCKDLENNAKTKKLLNEIKLLKLKKGKLLEQIQAKKKSFENKDALVSKNSSELSILYETKFKMMSYCEKLKALIKVISETHKAFSMVTNNSKESQLYHALNDIKQGTSGTLIGIRLTNLIQNNNTLEPSDVYSILCECQTEILTSLSTLNSSLFQSSSATWNLEPLAKHTIEVTGEIEELKKEVESLENEVSNLKKDFSDQLIKISGGDRYSVEESCVKWLEQKVKKQMTLSVQPKLPSLPPTPYVNPNIRTTWEKEIEKLNKELSNSSWKRVTLDDVWATSGNLEEKINNFKSIINLVEKFDTLFAVKIMGECDDSEIELKEKIDDTLARLGCSSEQSNIQYVIKKSLEERDILKSVVDVWLPSFEEVKSIDNILVENSSCQLNNNIEHLKNIIERIKMKVSSIEDRSSVELVEYLSKLDSYTIDNISLPVWIQRLENSLKNIEKIKSVN